MIDASSLREQVRHADVFSDDLALSSTDEISSDNKEFQRGSLIVHFATSAIPLVLQAAWSGYLSAWLSYVLAGTLIGVVSHGLFHVEMQHVADVCLSLFLFYVGVRILAELFELAEYIESVGWLYLVYSFATCTLWLLLPFALVLGFMIYGAFTGTEFTGTSFMFKGYVAIFADAYTTVAASLGDFLGAITTTETSSGAKTEAVDIDLFIKYLQALSLILAIGGQLLGSRRDA
ncbi:MAG: hypothetical protein ACK6DM_01560 [Alphaproteobacteria bacterium]